MRTWGDDENWMADGVGVLAPAIQRHQGNLVCFFTLGWFWLILPVCLFVPPASPFPKGIQPAVSIVMEDELF